MGDEFVEGTAINGDRLVDGEGVFATYVILWRVSLYWWNILFCASLQICAAHSITL